MAIFHDGQIKDGFVKIPNIIFRSGLPMRAVVVLGNIMSHAEYFPVTVSMIADQLGISRETVNKAIQDLEEAGLIRRMKAPAKNGQWQRNDYRLNNNKLNLMAAKYVLEQSDRGQNLGTDHGQNPDMDRGQNLATKKTISKTPSLEDQSPLTPQGEAAGAPAEPKDSKTEPHQLPQNWQPDNKLWAAMSKKYPQLNLHDELQKFRDYWHTRNDKQSFKVDWGRTWQNRLKAVANPKSSKYQPRLTKSDQASQWAEDMIKQIEAEEGVSNEPLPF